MFFFCFFVFFLKAPLPEPQWLRGWHLQAMCGQHALLIGTLYVQIKIVLGNKLMCE